MRVRIHHQRNTDNEYRQPSYDVSAYKRTVCHRDADEGQGDVGYYAPNLRMDLEEHVEVFAGSTATRFNGLLRSGRKWNPVVSKYTLYFEES